ncbi:uncharacterized protein LOC142318981 isoform X2 [Lycorma delicatula]|uniref:uncharacterized protein LOC142318981 isoform X2 n=1 Tax=Lycorma delicatula TaxID=130591 RepID=UPI003F5120AD
MMVLHALLLLLLAYATGTHQEDYDLDEQFDTSTVSVDTNTFPVWLEEEDEETELAVPKHKLCPPIPPLVESKTETLCNKTVCSDNGNCSNSKENVTLMCCFNGCVKTCMPPLDPPPAFDWIEESADTKKLIKQSQSAHSSPPETVALPGGCLLSPTQMTTLEIFKENQHVSECFCNTGSVFCKINGR